MSGAYWGISSSVDHYEDPPLRGSSDPEAAYPQELVSDVISKVRTDLDAFSAAECAVLENHGYLLADAAIRRHVPGLAGAPAPDLTIPHPDWMDEARVRRALARSHERSFLGHF